MKRSAWVAVAGMAVTAGMLAVKRLAGHWGKSRNVPAPMPESLPAYPKPILTGEPGEIITISIVAPYISTPTGFGARPPFSPGPQLFQSYVASNRRNEHVYSDAWKFDAASDHVHQEHLQRFVRQLEQSGWQRLDGLTLQWRGPNL
jgi:hypothetical protein